MAYFRKGLKKSLAPDPHGMAGAIAGTFLVGDGTLVGQGSSYVQNTGKPKLVLAGKAFTATIFTGDFEVVAFPNRPALVLRGKLLTVTADSTVVPQLPAKLILKGKSVTTIVPIFAHAGKSSLVLQGKPFTTPISAVVSVGKPTLILNGKLSHGGVIALTPTIPIEITLVPAVPATVDLVASAPQSYDLVPTEVEFR